jgi:hypothetical protein
LIRVLVIYECPVCENSLNCDCILYFSNKLKNM